MFFDIEMHQSAGRNLVCSAEVFTLCPKVYPPTSTIPASLCSATATHVTRTSKDHLEG